MNSQWKEFALADLFEFSSGKSIAPGGDGEFPAYGSNGLIGHSPVSLFPSGIIIGRVGAYCGSVALSSRPFWASDNTIVTRPRSGVAELRFGYYLLLNAKLNSWAGGAAQPLLTQSVLKPLRFRAPSLQLQLRIASILGAYDDLIDVNRRRIGLLEETARRLFDDAVTKAVGGLPHPGGASSDIQKLPAGWSIKPLHDVAELLMGQSPPSAELNTAGSGLSFHQGVSDFGLLFPGRRVFCEFLSGKRIAAKDDILFSVRAPVGRINVATEALVLGRGVAAIRPRTGSRAFMLAHLRATFYKPDLIGNGAIYKAVNRRDVERIPIVQPPAELIKRLDPHFQTILDALLNFDRSNRVLMTSKDLLLPRLISGELSVSAAERELEAAA